MVSTRAELGFPSYALRHDYDTTIPDDELEKTPRWKEADENPPVSARKAMRLANALADKLEPDTDDFKRELESLALCAHDGKWYWRAEYEWHVIKGGSTGILPNLTIIVLMNGAVVQPKVTRTHPVKMSDE